MEHQRSGGSKAVDLTRSPSASDARSRQGAGPLNALQSLQRGIGNQAMSQLLRSTGRAVLQSKCACGSGSGDCLACAREEGRPQRAASSGTPGPANADERNIFPARAATSRTRAPDGEIDSERVTLDGGDAGVEQGDAGDAGVEQGDAGDSLPGGLPSEGPAAPMPCCQIASGPTYTPSAGIPGVVSGGRKSFPFSMAATFTNLSPKAILPNLCEVRQYIKWDEKSAAGMGGPPHSGFPAATPADTWIEDRDDKDKRYGHRSGPHSDPIASGGDEYTTNGAQDQAFGDTYDGRDTPSGPATLDGKWFFRLDVIDTANGDAVKASSSVIMLDWTGPPADKTFWERITSQREMLRRAFEENRYGCWCGPGNVCPEIRDAMDGCCKDHDLEYDRLHVASDTPKPGEVGMWSMEGFDRTVEADAALVLCTQATVFDLHFYGPAAALYRSAVALIFGGRVEIGLAVRALKAIGGGSRESGSAPLGSPGAQE